MLKSKRPVIGINLDHQTDKTYSEYPWYALRENYCSSVVKHGGIPINLPYQEEYIDQYLDMIDGLVIPGGRFDVSPHYYNEEVVHEKTEINSVRTNFEFNLCIKALKKNIPVLGICGGMQLLNVVNGGSLIQFIPETVPNALDHDQENMRNHTIHDITIAPDTLLHQIYPHTHARVNTSHRQAVKRVADHGRIGATAPDSVIEAIDFPDYHFCLGVQWHPEFLLTELDNAIFDALVTAAKTHA